ncbi:zinc finger protein 2-like [Sardina pilchardus]|uniref:zinc finger protein 2-like n=1 Tax=Sardina pilchardus TaxID=27697 RepID=UPI002E15481A
MLNVELLQEQVASVMAILSKAAVAEICKVIDHGFAEVKREMGIMRQRELEGLRSKVRRLTGEARAKTAYVEWSNVDAPLRRSVAVQVSEQGAVECSTLVDSQAQGEAVMQLIIKVEGGDEHGTQETSQSHPGQSDTSTEPHLGPVWAGQRHAPAARHSNALLPAASGPVKREEDRQRVEDAYGDSTSPFTHTHLTHSQNCGHTHTQESGHKHTKDIVEFGGLQLELKAEQQQQEEEEEGDQKRHAIPKCPSPTSAFSSPPDSLLPLSSSASSEPSSSSLTLPPCLFGVTTTEATATTGTPTLASVSPHLLRCPSCPKSFWQKAALKRHEISHSDVRQFGCDVCGKRFKMRANLQQHMVLHSGRKPFACRYCGKCFTHPSNMKTHQRIHTGERPYQCPACGQTFNQHTSLTRHQRRHHKRPHDWSADQGLDERPLACLHCDQRFANASDLKEHQHVHTGERPYQCSVCARTFTQHGHLTRHQKKLHSGITAI